MSAATQIKTPEPEIIDLSGKYTPTGRQWEGHITPEMYPLFGGAMGSGKTVWLVNEGLQLSLDTSNNRGAIFRWENRAFKPTTGLTMAEYIPSKIISRHNLTDQFYQLVNGSVIYYGGLKPQPGIGTPYDRIKSMDLGWFAIDEASEVPEPFFLMLCSRLRLDRPGIRYKGLATSNPEPGWVKERWIDKDLKDHKFIPALPGDNPHNPDDYEQRLRDIFDDDWISRYVDGNWDIKSEGNRVFPYSWVRAAMQRSIDPPAVCDAVALDIASEEGEDETVTTGRWGQVTRYIETIRYQSTTETVGKLKLTVDKLKPRRLLMDSVGIGIMPYETMKVDGYKPIAFVAGSKAIKKDKYVDMKAEAYWEFRKKLEDGVVDLPDDDLLSAQLCSIKYEIQGDKRIRIESKRKSKGKGSPDRAESIIMANYEGKGYKKKGRVYVG